MIEGVCITVCEADSAYLWVSITLHTNMRQPHPLVILQIAHGAWPHILDVDHYGLLLENYGGELETTPTRKSRM